MQQDPSPAQGVGQGVYTDGFALIPYDILPVPLIHPRTAGVYRLLHEGSVVYVGESVDVLSRVIVHRKEGKKPFDAWWFEPMEGKVQREHREAELIREIQPRYNLQSMQAPTKSNSGYMGRVCADRLQVNTIASRMPNRFGESRTRALIKELGMELDGEGFLDRENVLRLYAVAAERTGAR